MLQGVPPSTICLFSDLDGTMIHFESTSRPHVIVPVAENAAVCRHGREPAKTRAANLLPNSTLGRGIVSHKTIELMSEFRRLGGHAAIITGARESTLLKRLPSLPASDVIVAETGGILWWQAGSVDLNAPFDDGTTLKYAVYCRDVPWHAQHAGQCGPLQGAKLVLCHHWTPSATAHQATIVGSSVDAISDAGEFGLSSLAQAAEQFPDLLDKLFALTSPSPDHTQLAGQVVVPAVPLHVFSVISEAIRTLRDAAPPRHSPPPPSHGVLWDLQAQVRALGYVMDTHDYSTTFRIDVPKTAAALYRLQSDPTSSEATGSDLARWALLRRAVPPQVTDTVDMSESPPLSSCSTCVSISDMESALRALLEDGLDAELPPTLTYRVNLRKYDVYPASSGKGRAMQHILRHHQAVGRAVGCDTVLSSESSTTQPTCPIVSPASVPATSGTSTGSDGSPASVPAAVRSSTELVMDNTSAAEASRHLDATGATAHGMVDFKPFDALVQPLQARMQALLSSTANTELNTQVQADGGVVPYSFAMIDDDNDLPMAELVCTGPG